MGSPVAVSPPSSNPTLPPSDLTSTNSLVSTQDIDTQYLQGLVGMRLGVSTGLDSEMLGMMSMRRIVLRELIFLLQIWRLRSQDHLTNHMVLLREIPHLTSFPGVQSHRMMKVNLIVTVGYRCDTAILREIQANLLPSKIDDTSIFCEGGCTRWFHVW
jgi:meiosis-specific protein HOP1